MLNLKQKLFFTGAILLVITGLILASLLYLTQKKVSEPFHLAQEEMIKVRSGMSINGVLQDFESLGVLQLEWRPFVDLWLRFNPEYRQPKIGTYQVSADMSLLQLLDNIRQGREKQFSLTLIEGHTWKQWRQQLEKQPGIVWPESLPEDWLGNGQFAEGWLMPDTYHYTAGTPAQSIVKRAHNAMEDYLAQAWETRDQGLPYDNPYQVLIMASIIEKETGLPSERPLIARVFINRLNIKMRLQTDPTIIYGMGDKFDGNIRRRDKYEATAYNTYVIKGLPPTPIAMPGRAAIDAALHPDEGEELYIVSRGDGSHVFSETLAQHNAAVRRYQLKIRE